jgi:hypothetical protein
MPAGGRGVPQKPCLWRVETCCLYLVQGLGLYALLNKPRLCQCVYSSMFVSVFGVCVVCSCLPVIVLLLPAAPMQLKWQHRQRLAQVLCVTICVYAVAFDHVYASVVWGMQRTLLQPSHAPRKFTLHQLAEHLRKALPPVCFSLFD